MHCSQQGLGGGNAAEQPQNCFPKVSRKILHSPCRARAWPNKNLFRTIRKKIFSAPQNWCLNFARSWGLEWETEALSSSEHLTWGSAKIWLLNRNLNFPRAALSSRFRTRAQPWHWWHSLASPSAVGNSNLSPQNEFPVSQDPPNPWGASPWCCPCELCPAGATAKPHPGPAEVNLFNCWLYLIADFDRNRAEAQPCWGGEFLSASTQQGSHCLTRLKKLLWIVRSCQRARIWHMLKGF